MGGRSGSGHAHQRVPRYRSSCLHHQKQPAVSAVRKIRPNLRRTRLGGWISAPTPSLGGPAIRCGTSSQRFVSTDRERCSLITDVASVWGQNRTAEPRIFSTTETPRPSQTIDHQPQAYHALPPLPRTGLSRVFRGGRRCSGGIWGEKRFVSEGEPGAARQTARYLLPHGVLR
jgi:hypothetical protein